jgi:uncharacterized membrane protein YphA (DoxX/SURF4 family)
MATTEHPTETPQVEDVHGSGIYPGTGPFPAGDAVVRSPAALGHPEERAGRHGSLHWLETAALLTGRAIFGGYFLYSGLNHLMNGRTMAGYARAKGVRFPRLAVAGSGLLLVSGGLSVLTGARPKIGTGLIATFLIGVSPQMHAFWREEAPASRTQEMVHFTKNAALLGAALLTAAHPEPWPLSLQRPRQEQLALRRP